MKDIIGIIALMAGVVAVLLWAGAQETSDKGFIYFPIASRTGQCVLTFQDSQEIWVDNCEIDGWWFDHYMLVKRDASTPPHP